MKWFQLFFPSGGAQREEKQQIRAFFCYVNLIERTLPWRRQANSINWNNLVLCFFCEEFMEGNKIQINTEKAEGPFLYVCLWKESSWPRI